MQDDLSMSKQIDGEEKLTLSTEAPDICFQSHGGDRIFMAAELDGEGDTRDSAQRLTEESSIKADGDNDSAMQEVDGSIPNGIDFVQSNITDAADKFPSLVEDVVETDKLVVDAAVVTVVGNAGSAFAALPDGIEECKAGTVRELEVGKVGESSEHTSGGIMAQIPDIFTMTAEGSDNGFVTIEDANESVELIKQPEFVSEESLRVSDDVMWARGSAVNVNDVIESSDGNKRVSLKRSCSTCFDNTPSVQVIYKCLTRESKNKLKELLQQWAEWHGEFVSTKEAAEDHLEDGDETYFSSLKVRGMNYSSVSFWMDKPSKKARIEDITSGLTSSSNKNREKEVPLYDRAEIGALISQDAEMSVDGGFEYIEGSRCFNCGSYSHSLKDCPRPRDNAAISSARRLLAEKRGSGNGPRSASRYYQSSPGGKFDDLKPGILGRETRLLLGIGEHDPPPWLNRMRELGYPPGYLEDQEEEESGIAIYGITTDTEDHYIGEDGEIVGERIVERSGSKKMKVHFPGVNAPIPDDADVQAWGSADARAHDDPYHMIDSRSLNVDGGKYSGFENWECPPGVDKYRSSSKMRPPGFEGSLLSRTPPWHISEAGRLCMIPPPVARSPHLGRSPSDPGRQSPHIAHDGSHYFSSLSYYSGSRQSPLLGTAPLHSPPILDSQRPQRVDSREEDSRRRAWARAQDALQSLHSRSDRYPSA
ncbi:hypothetical protein KP509_27G028700 [Ceratopteris richardii]|uniref:CCHC-type domain-containing protein n=1 Tax=Ceratopteris richardii TaxID=49495 RepID=A0A8T2RHI1_CERRI|nr:hypothetical protein KP509_27G028700 [Ceratopteris richardii]